MDQDVRTGYPPFPPLPAPPPPPLRRRKGSGSGVLVALILATVLTAVAIAVVLVRDDNSPAGAAVSRSPSAQPAKPHHTQTAAPPLPGRERYENAEFGFTVEYPETWVLDESPNGRSVDFRRGLMVDVNVRAATGVFDTPRQFLNVMWMALKSKMIGVEEIEKTEPTVAGLPAASIEGQGRLPQLRQVSVHFLLVVVFDGTER